jgi:hypothetical protein
MSDIIATNILRPFRAGTYISGTINRFTTKGTASNLLFTTQSGDITATITYLKSSGKIQSGGLFKGKLISCEIDCRGQAQSVVTKLHQSAEIEHCKFLSDSGFATITATSATIARIVYTITNRGFTNITASHSTNYNIDSTSII